MIQEMITGLYLITQDDVKIPINQAAQLVYMSNANDKDLDKLSNIIKKAKEEGRDYLTGKEVASIFLPDDFILKMIK